jgi:integrase
MTAPPQTTLSRVTSINQEVFSMTQRRNRGEGSVYRRKDGTWCASVSQGRTSSGERRRFTAYAHTEREARDQLVRLRAAALDGTLTRDWELTVGSYLERWLDTAASLSVRRSTLRTYTWIVRRHLVPNLGDIRVTRLSPTDVQTFYATLASTKLGARSREMVHNVLHRALTHAVRCRLLTENPTDGVRRPRPLRRTIAVLDPQQIKLLLAVSRADRLHALYALAVTTGLRQGELLALQWSDVDLARRRLAISHNLVEIDGVHYREQPKTRHSVRPIDLPRLAVTALREHRDRMRAEGHHSPWVFCDRLGGPLRKSNFTRRSFKPLLRAAGLPNIRFHDLRHAAASLLLKLGVHPKVVQERLGHSRVSLTLDTYSHLMPSIQRSAATKLDAFLRQRTSERGYKMATTELPALRDPRRRSGKRKLRRGFVGAGNGVRTRDPQLGKLMLYQLSYARIRSSSKPAGRPAVKVALRGAAARRGAATP